MLLPQKHKKEKEECRQKQHAQVNQSELGEIDRFYNRSNRQDEKYVENITSYDIPDGDVTPGGNWGSFIAACRAGDPSMANGNAVDAHRGCVLGHLMNNSYRLGENVPFNEAAKRFGDNTDAYEHFMKLHTIMKDGVGLPADGTNYVVGPWLTFNPETEITYQIPQKSNIELTIFNLQGQKIRTLFSGQQSAGTHRVKWNGVDENGNAVASGVYLYQIRAGKFVKARKMSLLR